MARDARVQPLSAVRACRAAIPLLIERGGGSIVNVTSGHARQPSAVNVHYGAAKAALTNLTKALSEEFGADGIRVNSVCPDRSTRRGGPKRAARPTSSPRTPAPTARRS